MVRILTTKPVYPRIATRPEPTPILSQENPLDASFNDKFIILFCPQPLGNRQNLLPLNYWALSDEGSDFSSFEDDPNDEDYDPVEDTFWEIDGAEDNGGNIHDLDNEDSDIDDRSFHPANEEGDGDDGSFHPDNENYPEYDEIEELFDSPESYVNEDYDCLDDGDDDIDYVTFPGLY